MVLSSAALRDPSSRFKRRAEFLPFGSRSLGPGIVYVDDEGSRQSGHWSMEGEPLFDPLITGVYPRWSK